MNPYYKVNGHIIPKQWKINKAVYTIRFIKRFRDKEQEGECDFNKKLIRMIRNCSSLPRVFLHELQHAYLFEYGHQQIDDDFEHAIIAVHNDLIFDLLPLQLFDVEKL